MRTVQAHQEVGRTRRRFLARAGTAAVAAVVAPQALAAAAAGRRAAPVFGGGAFPDGVISGDPGPTGITLWTRVEDVEGAGGVVLEVARDDGFRDVVARRAVATSAALGHTVKARVSGLRPHERYHYRFETRGAQSIPGEFRTAPPPGSNAPVRFAFFSCQDFPHGWFNAHELLAREDVDFALNLGDYIYAEVYHRAETAVRRDTVGEARTLEQYRRKYAQARSDPSLRRMHARIPLVSTWDDHEVFNDYAGAALTGAARARRAAAYRAWFESMPTYPTARGTSRIYRALPFGRVLDLFVLDERQYRAPQPCSPGGGPPCDGLGDPRALLGLTQHRWLRAKLERSTAAWKVLGNPVMAMESKVSDTAYDGFDSWQGYPVERATLLEFVRAKGIEDVVFATGDAHTFVAGDVRTASGKTVATEFVTGSVTSGNPGEGYIDLGPGARFAGDDANPGTPPAAAAAYRSHNPWVADIDFDHHGYAIVEASRRRLEVRFRRLATIKRRGTVRVGDLAWTLERGRAGIVEPV